MAALQVRFSQSASPEKHFSTFQFLYNTTRARFPKVLIRAGTDFRPLHAKNPGGLEIQNRREGNRLELLQYQNILNGYFPKPAIKL